ncbi:MAG: cobalamin-dependent protein [Planctomycetota bacterium]
MSLFTNYFDNAIAITNKIKSELKVPIIWGGIHPTVKPYECLEYADIVCVGEGEYALVELVKSMNSGISFYDIPGLIFKKRENGSKAVRNIPGKSILVRDLDLLPFPDYNYDTHYILSGGKIQKMNKNLLEKYSKWAYLTFHYPLVIDIKDED